VAGVRVGNSAPPRLRFPDRPCRVLILLVPRCAAQSCRLFITSRRYGIAGLVMVPPDMLTVLATGLPVSTADGWAMSPRF
jgi:hypothetical protein